MPLPDAIAMLADFRAGLVEEVSDRPLTSALDVVLAHAKRTNPPYADFDTALTHAQHRVTEAINSDKPMTLNAVHAIGFIIGAMERMRDEITALRYTSRPTVTPIALVQAIVHLENVWAEEVKAGEINIDRVSGCIVKIDRALTGEG